ncbi:MAG: 50S ribosomal protein L30 [Bacteroidales bacterium]|nr:50S ribosomal protein L30 [Bacteroidales bacterium]
MAKLKLTQVISSNGCDPRQKANLRCLGIRRMNQSVIVEETPVAKGQISRVAHLLKIEKI